MKIDYIIAVVCITAIMISLQWNFSQLPVSRISIVNPSSIIVNESSSFSLLIDDARINRSYSAAVLVDDVSQGNYVVHNGTNSLNFMVYNNGLSRVEILVTDADNEYNGYGSKATPWLLYFVVNASE